MPLRDLRAIYEVLFRDGVMVAKKDKRPQTMHPEIEGVSNLQVIRAMGSLKSRGCVKETFAWRHFYWYLTNEGIVYLRDYLHLPPEIVPASLQRVRKPAATLAIAHRAARVQSVEGPTSYVPKPGRRSEAESQEALAERQSYRHRMMGPGERESNSDRTPRFRGRPMAAEPVRQKASWETEDRPQPLFRKGGSFQSEPAVMEESGVKRVAYQQSEVSRGKPATKAQEWKVTEVQKEKAIISAQVQRAASKPEVSQASLASVSTKAALPLLGAAVSEDTGAASSKITAAPSAPKTNKEKPRIIEETVSVKSVKVVPNTTAALSGTELKEEKTQKKTVKPVNSAEVKAEVEMATDNVKPQEVVTKAVAKEEAKPITDAVTAPPVTKTSPSKEVKEEKTMKVVVDSVKSAEVKAEKPGDKVKGQDVTSKVVSQDTFKVPTEPAIPVITKQVNKDVKLEKSVKPAEVKTSEEARIDQEKDRKKPQTSKLPTDANSRTTVVPALSKTELSSAKIIQEPKVTPVTVSAKAQTDEKPQKTTVVAESPILEVKTHTATFPPAQTTAEDTEPVNVKVTVTEVTTAETTDVKVTPQVKKEETAVTEEVLKIPAQSPAVALKDSPQQLGQSAAGAEVNKEIKQAVEAKSKSKRKKKKSPGEISEAIQTEELAESVSAKEKPPVDKPPEVVAENPTPLITSESKAVCLSIKTETDSPVVDSKTRVQSAIGGGETKEVSHQITEITKIKVVTETKSVTKVAAPKAEQVASAPPVVLPDNAKVTEEVKESSVGKMTQQPLISDEKSNVPLIYAVPPRPEEPVTKVETVTVQKVTKVELKHTIPKNEDKGPAELLEAQEPIAADKPTEESAKSRKKGKGKKQAQAAVSDNLNTGSVAEALPSTNITSLPEATVNDHLVTASEPTEGSVSAKKPPERMRGEETSQSAAVLSEAQADKREVEPALLVAEKIKQEVPKPKTSSTAREAHAAGELASAAPVKAEAAAAQAQASPLAEKEEPPKVAQLSASQAAERCTENRLSVSEASKREQEKKSDSEEEEEDTPSVPVTQAAAKAEQLHLGHTCESTSSDVEEAAMKKKVVVVEEIVEVKQILSPQAAGQQSPPPPVQAEEEEEALDLDVLEAIAIEKAVLSEAAAAKVQAASPDDDWDHSLAEPEEKTWPNFIEGLFE